VSRLFLFFFFIPLNSVAQVVNLSYDGIRFDSTLTWEQIKEKAYYEGKFVFIDCYTTWCGPCKLMERDIYKDSTVGRYINSKFISIKIQMDSSKKDSDRIKEWYGLAHLFQNRYKINAFPTYLFFAPSGEIVHREKGLKTAQEFINIAGDALIPEKQYYSLIDKYNKGLVGFAEMPRLVDLAKQYNEPEKSIEIADKYIHMYLNVLNEDELMQSENLKFINSVKTVLRSSDRIFTLFYLKGLKIDSIMYNKSFSTRILDYVITKEEIEPKILCQGCNKPPHWKEIFNVVKSKYNYEYAERNILKSKVLFYKNCKNWRKYARLLTRQVDYLGIKELPRNMWGALYLNNNAWEVFMYSDNKMDLRKALSWSNYAIMIDSSYLLTNNMDTKANILYKLGKKKLAISLEENIINIDRESAKKKGQKVTALYQETLLKFKKGEPTWPQY